MEAERVAAERVAEALLAAAGGDHDLAEQLAEVFLEDSPATLEGLARAVAGGDAGALGSAAHTLKGMAATLGFARLAEAALALETVARDGLADGGAGAALERLASACMEAQRAARAYLGGEA